MMIKHNNGALDLDVQILTIDRESVYFNFFFIFDERKNVKKKMSRINYLSHATIIQFKHHRDVNP